MIMKFSRIFLLALLLISITGVCYWYYFIQNRLITDINLLYVCKVSDNPTVIRISLAESAEYITQVMQRKQGDTLFIEVYSTTIYNIFETRKRTFIDIDELKDVRKIKICEKNYFIETTSKCNNLENPR